MASTYSVSQAQSRLPALIRKAEQGEPVTISRRNVTVAYLISRERMEAMVETMEILANREAMKALDAHRTGRTKFLPASMVDRDR